MYALMIIVAAIIGADAVAIASGFGLATVLTPLLGRLMPFEQVLWVVGILHWFSSIWKIAFFWHHIEVRIVLFFGIPAVIASLVGALLVGKLLIAGFAILFGLFLIGYAVILLVYPTWYVTINRSTLVIGGTMSGLCAGIFGIRGAVRAIFLSALQVPKEVYISTIGVISLLEDSARLIGYFAQGFGQSISISWLLIFIGATLIGAYVGRLFVARISQQTFRRFIAVLLLVSGVYYILFGMPGSFPTA